MQYDQWGRRVDDLQTSEGWRGLKAKMQEEGAIGIFFERKYGEFSRVYGFMKEFLATGDSSVVSVFVKCSRFERMFTSPVDILPLCYDRWHCSW